MTNISELTAIDLFNDRVASLNDRARHTLTGCKVLITRGIQDLGQMAVNDILARVRSFDSSIEDNDPYGDRSFGEFEWGNTSILWKIDCFDPNMEMHSFDPSDSAITLRVLTVMLDEEY
jgi:hypothetical protein